MKIRTFALATTPTALSGAVLAVFALAGLAAVATTNTEAVVAERFVAALESPAPVKADTSFAATQEAHPVSGTEAYWLNRQHATSEGAEMETVRWSAPRAADLAIGDRINVPNRKGSRILEVVAVANVEPPPEALAPGTLDSRRRTSKNQIAVTFRDLTTANGTGPLVTFVVPAETDLAAVHKLPQSL